MRDILADVEQWLGEGKRVALATVIETWGSAPRGVGAHMALTAAAEMSGSVSGGCVEGAVVEAGIEVLEKGVAKLLKFGVADETAWDVGLACGGNIEVLVRPIDVPQFEAAKRTIAQERTFAIVYVVEGPDAILGREMLIVERGAVGGSISEGIDGQAVAAGRKVLTARRSRRVQVTVPGEESTPVVLFVDVVLPRASLVIVGGVHIALALVHYAQKLDFHTVVVDPRRAFGSAARFQHVDQLIQTWPEEAFAQNPLNESSAVVVLTHDPKIDDGAVKTALASEAFYIGVLGSRKTHAKRRERLLDAGVSEAQLARLHAPIGLDLGGRTPEEIALAVMAEIVAERNR